MKCPRCGTPNNEAARRCSCGFPFDQVPLEELSSWFDEVRLILENAYTAAPTPWNASGKSGTFEEWTRLRVPNLAPVDRPGSYLDIGCANGFLLDCLVAWSKLKGVALIPYGLDYSEKFVSLARRRLIGYQDNIFLGNAYTWVPPRRFDYVRTELMYVPRNYRLSFVERLLAEFLTPGGKLLLSNYRSRHDDLTQGWIGDDLERWGYRCAGVHPGYNKDGLELCRVYVLEP